MYVHKLLSALQEVGSCIIMLSRAGFYLQQSPQTCLSAKGCDQHIRPATTTFIQIINRSEVDSRPQCFEHGCGGRRFSCTENYQRHLRERNRAGSVTCSFCQKTFSRKSNRDQHQWKARCRALENVAAEIMFSLGTEQVDLELRGHDKYRLLWQQR